VLFIMGWVRRGPELITAVRFFWRTASRAAGEAQGLITKVATKMLEQRARTWDVALRTLDAWGDEPRASPRRVHRVTSLFLVVDALNGGP
jgi:hypothetical protein